MEVGARLLTFGKSKRPGDRKLRQLEEYCVPKNPGKSATLNVHYRALGGVSGGGTAGRLYSGKLVDVHALD